MGGIFDVLKSIGEFIASGVDFVITFFSDLVYIIRLMGATILKLPQYLSFFPSVVVSLFITAVSVVIVYRVAGRD